MPRLCVCNDQPLPTWILGFGGAARVVTPPSLAQEILEEVQTARERYLPGLPFDSRRSLRPGRLEPLKMALDDRQHNWLAA